MSEASKHQVLIGSMHVGWVDVGLRRHSLDMRKVLLHVLLTLVQHNKSGGRIQWKELVLAVCLCGSFVFTGCFVLGWWYSLVCYYKHTVILRLDAIISSYSVSEIISLQENLPSDFFITSFSPIIP